MDYVRYVSVLLIYTEYIFLSRAVKDSSTERERITRGIQI